MDAWWLGVYVVVAMGLGALGVAFFERAQAVPLPRSVGLAATFGAGVLGYALFVLELFGVHPDRGTFVSLSFAALPGLALALARASRRVAPAPRLAPRARFASVVLLTVLAGCFGAVALKALGLGLYEWDAFAIWALKAKVIAGDGLVPRPAYFSDVSLSYSHLDYPLMVPLQMVGVFAVLGRVDDQLAKLPEVLCYVGLMALVFSFCRRRTSLPTALAVTVLVLAAPCTLRHAGSGMAEVQLMAFYTASVVCVIEWREAPRWRTSALCGVMSAFAALTKNEGLALGAINCVAMVAFPPPRGSGRRLWGGAGLCALVFVVLVLPWLVWSHCIPRTHGDYLGNLSARTFVDNAARIPVIAAAFAGQVTAVAEHGLLWLVLLGTAALRWRTFGGATIRVAWLLLVLHLLSYALIFVVTPHDVRWHMASSLHRLVLHALPLAGMLVAMHLSAPAPEPATATPVAPVRAAPST
ncbi:MAG TPA: glycosyltransferase family 39 protein [Planctomycetota bacterium]|nr:glycosyltransferase family 39 protein [Planctomycetota bacterium]